MFQRNAWYMAAYSSEVGARLLPRTFLNEPVVMYRADDGEIVALEDSCPHRRVPLSVGKLVHGDRIQCGYHGLEFDRTGRCVFEPESKQPLSRATVKTYPVVETNHFVFIWMGDPALADPASVPSYHKKFMAEGWDTECGYKVQPCGYRMIIDNLLDLSHLGYVHATSAGNEDFGRNTLYKSARFTHPEMGEGVRLRHLVSDAPAPFGHSAFGDRIDRWTVVDFYPPSFIHILFGNLPAKSATLDFEVAEEEAWEVYHLATPETETTTHDFWVNIVQSGVIVGDMKVAFDKSLRLVIDEDEKIYAAQQAAIIADANAQSNDVEPKVSLKTDQALWLARRLQRKLILQEQGGEAEQPTEEATVPEFGDA